MESIEYMQEEKGRLVMAINIEYNFDKPKNKDGPPTEVRPNLRVTRCCGNCKFFIAKGNKGFRGYCKYPDPESKNLNKIKGESRNPEDLKTWSRAHMTMLCDLYQLKPTNLSNVGEWLERKVKNDGTFEEE